MSSDLFTIGGYSAISYGGGSTFAIVVIVLAALIAVATAVLFLPRHNKGRFSPGLNKLYDILNFDCGWAKLLIKIGFIFFAVTLFVLGVYVMFSASFLLGLAMWLSILVMRVTLEVLAAILEMRSDMKKLREKLVGEDAPAPGPGPMGYGRPEPPVAPFGAPGAGPKAPEAGPEDSSKPSAAFCGNCGTPLKPGAAFCPGCGIKVRK